MIDVNALRDGKEKAYYRLAAAVGGLVWLSLLVGTLGLVLIALPMMALPIWMAQQFFKASVLGHAARVSERQYPQVHAMVVSSAKALGLEKVPQVFIVNGDGMVNALALKFLDGQYVVLYASLVDMMVERKQARELKMIIAHELAHHAAGHTHFWRNLLILPAKYIPYVGMAYSRACEFTADRLAAAVVGDIDASKRALLAIAIGMKTLRTDVDAFVAQEADMPQFFGFINEVYSSHPRMTRRIMALDTMRGAMPRRRTAELSAGEAPLAVDDLVGRVPASEVRVES